MQVTQSLKFNIFPPLVGVLLDLSEVPDPVFAEKMVGDGVGIDPLENKIYAPVDGIIKSVHHTRHAITFDSEKGFDILVHIGLETVSLKGEGFKIHVKDGDRVTQGQVIGEFDLDFIAQSAKSLITPVLIADLDPNKISLIQINQDVTHISKPIMEVIINDNSQAIQKQAIHLIKSKEVIVTNTHGIHARPAAMLSTIARKYDSDIFIEKNKEKVNVKSVISLMKLAVAFNDQIYVYAENESIIQEIINSINDFVDNPNEDHHSNSVDNGNGGKIEGDKYFGFAASDGVATGKLVKRSEMSFEITEAGLDVVTEKEIFLKALTTVKQDIEYNLQHVSSHDEAYKNILGAHLVMLADPQIISDTESLIERNKSAAYSFDQIIKDNCKVLAASGNKLLIERQTDLKDLRNRVISAMSGVEAKALELTEPTILLADELTPTDMVNIDKNIVGMISVTGGATSHVAILARVKGIPLLVGVNSQILTIEDNIEVILDSTNGFVDLKPKQDDLLVIKERIASIERQKEIDLANASQESITIDGKLINCMANITSVKESKQVKANGGVGVGLFRTEFIFFDRDSAPTVEEQHIIYKDISDNLAGLPFTIRTLDAGGEKQVDYIKLPHEVNPVLGVRGIRLCLEQKELLINQLTAILKVDHPNIKVMLPMITSIEEYRTVKQIFEDLKKQYNVKHDIELGIMVEVPSVALLSEIFAREVAFFSIGTNDLTQYTLAIDREHPKLANQIDHLHPAVIRNIDLVSRGAKTNNKLVSICGLMASEKLAIPVLIGLGIDVLSMNSNQIAENKALIRKLSYQDCVETAKHCLSLGTVYEVRSYLSDKYKDLIG